jgi:hypothetical protein
MWPWQVSCYSGPQVSLLTMVAYGWEFDSGIPWPVQVAVTHGQSCPLLNLPHLLPCPKVPP